jgi:hypothetical protein
MIEDYATLDSRLKSFENYIGVPNPVTLSELRYIHNGNNIIRCLDCNNLFIPFCWNMAFWEKHRISQCVHLHKDYMFNISNNYIANVDYWFKKKHIFNFVKYGLIAEDDCRKYLENFLELKGPYATARLFRDYLMYLKYFQKDEILKNI